MSYWTNREEAHLKQLVLEAGKSDAEIAVLMGRSKPSIMHKRKYGLGIDQRVHWTPEEDDRLDRMLKTTDKSLAEIGKLLNRTEGAIQRRKERLGLKRIPVKLQVNNPADIAQLVKFKLAGWTHEAIAEVFGVHATYISNLLLRNGYKRFCQVKPKSRKRPLWTELEIHQLRKYIRRGYSDERIQIELPGRSLSAIGSMRRKITKHYLPKEARKLRERRRRWWRNRETIWFREGNRE